MVLNWLWNMTYRQKHVTATIILQKNVRGFLARRRVNKMLADLETKQQVMLVWHEITKQTKHITSLGENTRIDFEVAIDKLPTYHSVLRSYQKERSKMVEQIVNLDRYVYQMDNVGDPLPCRMFPVKSLFIKGTKIIPSI